jgi:hypothetical protein
MRTITKSHWLGCAWFWVWAFVGAALALGLISLGPLLLLPALIAMWLMGRRRPINGFGVLTGAGVILLVVAYLQRQGPGTTCVHTATSITCDQHLNPIPWLIVGLVCFVAGLVGHALQNR